jgi:hypothetical protein
VFTAVTPPSRPVRYCPGATHETGWRDLTV